MKKVIIYILLNLLTLNAIGNPLSPMFRILSFTYYSATNWSISCERFHYYEISTSDSIVVKTARSTACYYLKRNDVMNKSYLITQDSLTVPLTINKDSDIITIYYNSTFPTYVDSITLGLYPNAMFTFPKDSSITIMRTYGCFADYGEDLTTFYYSKRFTLKGIIYDRYGEIVPNQLFFSIAHYQFDGEHICMRDSFTTNAKGEYTFRDYQNYPEYHRNTIVEGIQNKDKHYVKIEDITIPDSQQTIVTRDIHLKDDLTESSIVQESKCMLYPNPAGTFAILQYSLQTTDETMVEIFNLQGICIERYTLKERTGSLHINLDSKYHAGMYLVQVKTGSKLLYSKQLIVIK